jgi:hypothetical protein
MIPWNITCISVFGVLYDTGSCVAEEDGRETVNASKWWMCDWKLGNLHGYNIHRGRVVAERILWSYSIGNMSDRISSKQYGFRCMSAIVRLY